MRKSTPLTIHNQNLYSNTNGKNSKTNNSRKWSSTNTSSNGRISRTNSKLKTFVKWGKGGSTMCTLKLSNNEKLEVASSTPKKKMPSSVVELNSVWLSWNYGSFCPAGLSTPWRPEGEGLSEWMRKKCPNTGTGLRNSWTTSLLTRDISISKNPSPTMILCSGPILNDSEWLSSFWWLKID